MPRVPWAWSHARASATPGLLKRPFCAALNNRREAAWISPNADEAAAKSRSASPGKSRSTSKRHSRPASASGKSGSMPKAVASPLPCRPWRAGSRINSTRHSSGKARRAITGAGSAPGPSPPSTRKPPLSKAPMPMPERAPRPIALARSGVATRAPCMRASAAATARPSCVPEPKPACSGLASSMVIRTPRGRSSAAAAWSR